MTNKYIYEEASFASFDDVRAAIKKSDKHLVCKSMPAIGMESNLSMEVYDLIELCLKSKDEWIRRAGYMCIYHLYVRFSDQVFSDRIISLIKEGMKDDNEAVQEMINNILDEVKEFSGNIYNQLYN